MPADDRALQFARGHRLHYDKVREVWLIQAPEKAYIADPIATEVLRLVDGQRSLDMMIDALQQKYDAPRDLIARDVHHFVDELKRQKVLA